jgi:hypothetical protein
MARFFPRSSNGIARAVIAAVIVLFIAGSWVAWGIENSPAVTRQGIAYEQPVPFSHEHHVRGLGIDCRYCHTSVTESSYAGLPPTKTCMTCHSQIWTNAPMLEPVRDSWRTGKPLSWQRVNILPHYVYFDHSIHIQKGVGCSSCHGQVDQMPLMLQAESLQMSWCIDCHRHPEKNLRPREQVFNMQYVPPPDQLALGKELVERYHVRSARELTDCNTCHR